MSNTVTSAFLPSQIKVKDFISQIEHERYVLYPGKGHLLEQNLFQVANMGQIFPKDCNGIIEVIRKVIVDTELRDVHNLK